MFTGIIDHCGTILAVEEQPSALRLLIGCNFLNLQEGESVAVDGICLTAVAPQTKHFYCDISPETLRLTTAYEFKSGRKVNLERALCLGDRMGGHWVTGHIDQQGVIKNILQQQEFVELEIENVTLENQALLSKKGSITVNGVSLTLNAVTADSFQLMLIPHTLERTNLHALQIGDAVNLEFDWMTRVINNQVKNYLSASK